jgi:hypothetical protein
MSAETSESLSGIDVVQQHTGVGGGLRLHNSDNTHSGGSGDSDQFGVVSCEIGGWGELAGIRGSVQRESRCVLLHSSRRLVLYRRLVFWPGH